MIGDLLSVPSDFSDASTFAKLSLRPRTCSISSSVRCSLFSVVHLYYYQFIAVVVLRLERQQIRVSDVLLPVAHAALYVADSDLGISYHAFTVVSYGLCIPMSNTSSIDSFLLMMCE